MITTKKFLMIILFSVIVIGFYFAAKFINNSISTNEGTENSLYYGVASGSENVPGAQGKNFNKNFYESPLINEKEIKIDERNFLSWFDELYKNPQRYSDKPFEMTANIFNIEIDGEISTYAGRYVLTNFEEKEKQGILLLTEEKFNEDEWVYLKGTISTETIHGQIVPVVQVDLIERTENKGKEFIYGF